jgi:hypothetical protein
VPSLPLGWLKFHADQGQEFSFHIKLHDAIFAHYNKITELVETVGHFIQTLADK